MIIDCPNCNFQQPFESEFCPNCGKRIKPLLEQQKKRKTKQGKKTRLTLLAFSALLFIGYIIFFYMQSSMKAKKLNLEPKLTRLERINLRPKRLTFKKDLPPKTIKIATLKNSEPSLNPIKSKSDNEVKALMVKPKPQEVSKTKPPKSLPTRELDSILLVDLYDCELNDLAPTLMTADQLADFMDCGQTLIEERTLSGDPFLVEETQDHRIMAQITKTSNQVQFELTLKVLEKEDYNFQSSYSFKIKEPSNTGVYYPFKPYKLKKEVFNALSNSAFIPMLFTSADKVELKGDITYLYIFLLFK